MREIIFRGKIIDKKSVWLYGGLIQGENYYAIERGGVGYYVDKNTIGQYTGLKDIKEQRVYEGDIIQYDFAEDCYSIGEIIFKNYCFYVKDSTILTPLYEAYNINIIGNIFDTPGLIHG